MLENGGLFDYPFDKTLLSLETKFGDFERGDFYFITDSFYNEFFIEHLFRMEHSKEREFLVR